MNILKGNNYSSLFSKSNESNGLIQETQGNERPNNDAEENIEIDTLSDGQTLEVWQLDKNWKTYLNASPCILLILSIIKYITLLFMFGLITFVLWECKMYFQEAKLQQLKFELQQKDFNNAVDYKLKHLDSDQKIIINNLENIRILTADGSQKIKEMFSFDKGALLQGYEENNVNKCEFIPPNLRFDCHPENGASELSCTKRGCCWNALHQSNYELEVLDVPYCYYPKNWSLYKYQNLSKAGNEFTGLLRLERSSFYKEDIPLVKIETTSIDDTTLRVKIFDPVKERYEPPIPKRSNIGNAPNPQYELKMDENIPGFKVVRSEDKKTLFNSMGHGGFIFADQFLQMSSPLPSSNIYGLGEHRTNLKLNTNWQKLTLFNKDQPPTENANLYGSHPFYMAVERSGKAHGVLFLNSNAMDVILQPTPAITFRSIGGIFDIYFFVGPTPADVLKQYSRIVGKPFLPPYWSLGFHLCKFGYGSVEKTRAVWKRTRDALIPFDTQWNDLDYMLNKNDFTYDKTNFKNLPSFIKELHDAGMHYIPIIDAGISASEAEGTYVPYDEGVKRKVLIYDKNTGSPFKGKVWNNVSTSWPDFTNPDTTTYYTEMMSNLHKDIAFDGAWIDMNEPSNFYNGHKNGCEANKRENPPYLPNVVGNSLVTKTICMSAKQHLGYHYDLHNLFGTTQAIAVNQALKQIRNKRPFIISRSTWEGHGFYAGHWTGDIYSSWHDLRMSIPEILAYSLFQIPMVGADICGFDGNTTAALCNRWMQLGAFYPFSRNHNSDDTIEQDPVAMGQLVINSSRKALRTRYYLLPYLYTLFYRAHRYGETVARPLFVEFPEDPETHNIDSQFLWGSCLLISPVLEENKTTVDMYIPRGMWYNYYTMESSYSIGKNYTLDAPLDTIPLLVRGGCILPAQEVGLTTESSRQKPFNLVIALDERETARGELYWDDGDSLDSIEKKQYKLFEFEVEKKVLTSTIVEGSFDSNMKLAKIVVMGVSEIIKEVYLNTKEIQFEYDKENMVLLVENIKLDFTDKFVLEWSDRITHLKEPTTPLPIYHQLTSHQPIINSSHYENASAMHSVAVSGAVNYFYNKIYIVFTLSLIIIKSI